MKEQLKDLFRAIQSYRIFINRYCKKSDIYNLMDLRCEALSVIADFEIEYGLSKSMKHFLKHRICQECRNTGIM